MATIPLTGQPRWAVYDDASDRIFANIREPAQILVLHPNELRIDRAIDVPAEGPNGLCIDGERLFCAADGEAVVVLHCETGAVLAAIPLPRPPDVVMHDASLRHLYVAIGEPGVICVVDTERLELVETAPTERNVHTIGPNPDNHTLYAFLPESEGAAVYADI